MTGNLSRYQYRVLMRVAEMNVGPSELARLWQGTLGSLLVRGLIMRGPHGSVRLTNAGADLLDEYYSGPVPERRTHNKDLTERVRNLLQVSRNNTLRGRNK